MPSIYDLASNYEIGGAPGIRLPVVDAPITPMTTPAAAAQPVMAPAATPAAGAGRNDQLLSLIGRYFPQGEDYGSELKTARETLTRESDAFNKLLQDAVNQPQASAPSKAEMYFRLAAAFGSPTKTGNFFESLGSAGSAASEMLKERRATEKEARDRRLQLGLEAQKLRLSGAKEDLTTLRQLAAEGMKDKRTIAAELIKDYVKSGQPESSAGKQAKDEGLQPGTPEFQKRVSQIAEMNVEKQMAQINSTLAQMSAAQANMALAQQKFDLQKQQATKLTGPELKLKTETEDSLNLIDSSMDILRRAYNLNKNSMSNSLIDKGARSLLEAAGSKDPILLNTQELENLLSEEMLRSASEKLKGVLSDTDMKLLQQVSGVKAKNQAERERIINNAFEALKQGRANRQKRLNEINQGLYRETNPTGGLE